MTKGNYDFAKHGNYLENGGVRYASFFVRRAERAVKLLWVVVRVEEDSGAETILRHFKEKETAEVWAERQRVKQPDRRPSHKFRHKFRIR